MKKKLNNNDEIQQLKAIIERQQIDLLRLTETEKLLSSVFDTVAGNHWWKDKKGIYRGCNAAMVDALGLKSKNDIIGKSDYELPWSAGADTLIRNDQMVMNTGKTQKGKEELAPLRVRP